MSKEVPLTELGEMLLRYPWGFLVTVGESGRARMLSVRTSFADGRLTVDAGSGTRTNVARQPDVTMVFPPADGREFSLIVDGHATVAGEQVVVTPANAVLHRPALRD
jgi:hypothetical protein